LPRLRLFLSKHQLLLMMTAVGFLVLLPQFLLWKHLTGNFLFYSYGEEGFDFSNPHIISALFSYKKGWLVYSPIMAFSILGLFFLRAKVEDALVPILIFMAINLFVITSWWSWYYGGSFGYRALIDAYALLALPLAALIQWLWRIKYLNIGLALILLFLVVLSQIQTIQYKKTYIHYVDMTKEVYWDIFMRLNISYDEKQEIWKNLEQK
jgi:hypothetical protein